MIKKLLFVAAISLTAVPQAGAWNDILNSIWGSKGNDTGGIIPWSPALRAYGYREAAQDHCRGYHKLARITSVKARYGDYVGFACEFPRNYDPVGHGDWWMKPMFGIF